MKLLMKIFIISTFFFLSWTDSFALSSRLTLSNIAIIFTIILFITFKVVGTNKLISTRPLMKEDSLLFIGIIFISLSGLFNPNDKTLNYIAAYLFVFIFCYISLKIALYNSIKWQTLLNINAKAVIFLSSFLAVEFVLKYFVGFNIQEVIPRDRSATAYYGDFPRSYGFATEPGVVGYYLNTLGPIAIYTIWNVIRIKKMSKIMFTIIIISAWTTTFSAAAVGFLSISILITFISNIIKEKLVITKLRLLLALFFSSLITFGAITISLNISLYNNIKEAIFPMLQKLTFDNSIGSANDRLGRWNEALNSLYQNPILGIGPGTLAVQGQGSPTNWYLFLGVESGLLSLFPFLLFLLVSLYRILISNVPGKNFFIIGFISGIGHLMVISTFQYIFLWILLLIFILTKQQSFDKKVKSEL